jgi:hypothetical protein
LGVGWRGQKCGQPCKQKRCAHISSRRGLFAKLWR